jgi:hypothetical protein
VSLTLLPPQRRGGSGIALISGWRIEPLARARAVRRSQHRTPTQRPKRFQLVGTGDTETAELGGQRLPLARGGQHGNMEGVCGKASRSAGTDAASAGRDDRNLALAQDARNDRGDTGTRRQPNQLCTRPGARRVLESVAAAVRYAAARSRRGASGGVARGTFALYERTTAAPLPAL